ncbi:MAG TPA: HNH endonuclease [Bacteroidia bacterium]|nr:HNH endonuclease [Bacteroidia bacterium]
MKFYVGVTDTEWYNYLGRINPEDVNFWQPGGRATFKAIEPGAPFLFKLKSPLNVIGGVGFFSTHSILPISMVWEIFANRNGAETYEEFYNNIRRLRARDNTLNENPSIGCIVLTNPIFFKPEDWIATPVDWSQNIVQGKSYSTENPVGLALWKTVESTLHRYSIDQQTDGEKSQLILEESEAQYGKSVLRKVRLGQGAFRVMVTDAYSRKCAISGERTLPVLEAAHIKPYAKSGPHFISNGLLLRSDIHKLFDNGYVTITNDLKVEVSKRIKEEYENGKEYYQFHGKTLGILPHRDLDRPSKSYIDWHNSNIFKG